MQTRDDVLAFAFPLAKKYAAEVSKRSRVHQDDIESDVMLAVTRGIDQFIAEQPVEPAAWWRTKFRWAKKDYLRNQHRSRGGTVSIDDEEAPDENPAYADPRSTTGFDMVDLLDFCGDENRGFVTRVASGEAVWEAAGGERAWRTKREVIGDAFRRLGGNGNRVPGAAA